MVRATLPYTPYGQGIIRNSDRTGETNTMVISPVILNLDSVHLSDEQFYQLCQNNQELKFERNAQGELTIMSPLGGENSNK